MSDKPEQKELLRILISRLYRECGVEVEPMYPKVLVRVLPREQQTKGGIILPEGAKQNKPVLEGVVLKTYKPFFQKIYLADADWVREDPAPEVKYLQKAECCVKPGDHILFPHIEFGIVPVWPLDDGVGDYRMVPEPLIIGTLEYKRQDVKEWLYDLLADNDGGKTEDEWLDNMVEAVLKNADVVRKDVVSLTMSGA